jgi:hypothetical protein
MECMFLQHQPHTVACNVPPVNPFEFIGAHRHLLLLACWAGIRIRATKILFMLQKTHEIFFWPTVIFQGWYVNCSWGTSLRKQVSTREVCEKISCICENPVETIWKSASGDTILWHNDVAEWQTSMERLLGDRSKTRNFWKSTYFLWEDLEVEWEPDSPSAVQITRNSPISHKAPVFGHVLRGSVA